MRTLLCTAGVAIALLVSTGVSQSEPQVHSQSVAVPAEIPATIIPIHTATGEPEVEDGIWGGAVPRYKVSFHGDMTFIPYLGKQYPHNQPFSWQTLSARVGDEVLAESGDEPVRWWSETRFEYRFGALTEAYDVRLDGLEQSFTLHRRPASMGDLVVTGRISSQMAAERCLHEHRALAFHDHNGTEIVRYGGAWVIDATGERQPIATSFDGEKVTLTVPKAFLGRATFPVTIDPLLTATGVIGNFDPTDDVDICRDDSANDLMVAYTLAVSGGDLDAFAYIAQDNFSSPVLVFSDVDSRWANTEICCATADAPQVYGVVFTRMGAVLSNQSRIRYQVRATGNTTFSATVQESIVTPNGSQYSRPDIGGTTFGNLGDYFMVVWQKDNTNTMGGSTSTSEIWAVPLDITGVTTIGGGARGTTVQVPKAVATADGEYPSVNDRETTAGSGATEWLVCWQEFAVGDTDWDIVGRKVNASSNVSSSRYFSPGARQKVGPQVAGRSGRYAIVYASGSTTQMAGKVTDVHGFGVDLMRLDWPFGSNSWAAKPTVQILDNTAYPDRRWEIGGIAQDSDTISHWAYFHRSRSTGRIYTGRVGYNGLVVEGPNVIVEAGSGTNVLGGITFDDDADRWAMAWGNGINTVMGNHFVYAAAAATSTAGISCSTASIAWSGPGQRQQIGCELSGLWLSGMPTGALSAVSIGFFTTSSLLPSPPFVRGCYQNSDALLVSDLQFGSSVTFQIPLPEFLGSGSVYFQGYHTNAAGTAFLSTQRLRVPFIK